MKIKGSVSLFMAMIFLLVISVISTTIISARIQCSRVEVSTSASLSCDSFFAQYDRDLFDKFGVLFFYADGADDKKALISRLVMEYIRKNIGTVENNLIGTKVEGINIEEISYATSMGGLLFMNEAVEYEKYAKVIDMAADYLNIDDVEEKTEVIGNIFENINNVSDVVSRIDDSVNQLMKKIYGVWIQNNQLTQADEEYYLKRIIVDINSYYYDGTTAVSDKQPINISESISIIKNNQGTVREREVEKLKKTVKGLLDTTEKIETKFKVSAMDYNTLEIEVEKIQSDIKSVEGVFGKETATNMCNDFEPLKDYKSELAKEVCDITLLEKTITNNKQVLKRLEELLNQEIDDKNLNEIRETFYKYSYDGMNINYKHFIREKQGSNLLKGLRKLFKQGVLGVVIPKDRTLSLKQIQLTDLSSDTTQIISSDMLKQGSGVTRTAKKIVYGEYVIDHFNTFLEDDKDNPLSYETEYIISGKKSDSENLYYVVKKLAAIRSALNFMVIMGDSEKKEQAESLARAMFGWTNIEALVKGAKYLVLYAWSYAEALTEIKALLSGMKVELIKTKSNWQLEYPDFITLNLNPDEEKCRKGLDYKMYLRALLMFENESRKALKTMDLIELWKISTGDKNFRFNKCIYGFVGELQYGIKGFNRTYEYKFAQTY